MLHLRLNAEWNGEVANPMGREGGGKPGAPGAALFLRGELSTIESAKTGGGKASSSNKALLPIFLLISSTDLSSLALAADGRWMGGGTL